MKLTRQAEDRQCRHQGDGHEAGVDLRPRSQLAQAVGCGLTRGRGGQQDDGEDGDGQQGGQLDDRLDADGLDQAAVVLGQVGPSRAEQDGEPGQHRRHDQDGQALGPGDGGARRDHLARHRQRLELKGDVGDRAQDGDARHRRAQRRALAVAGRDEIGHRADVLAPGGRGDAPPQRQQQGQPQDRPDVDGQILPPVARGRAHRPVIGPRRAVDGQRQGVERRPQHPAPRLDLRPLVPPGDAEQGGHVEGRQGQGGEAEHGRHLGRARSRGQAKKRAARPKPDRPQVGESQLLRSRSISRGYPRPCLPSRRGRRRSGSARRWRSGTRGRSRYCPWPRPWRRPWSAGSPRTSRCRCDRAAT